MTRILQAISSGSKAMEESMHDAGCWILDLTEIERRDARNGNLTEANKENEEDMACEPLIAANWR
jgi:hypothetical protein